MSAIRILRAAVALLLVAVATGAFAQVRHQVDLPGGGTVWATEDPTLAPPRLSLQAPPTVPFDGGRVATPVRFQGYANYAAFLERIEVALYRASDADRIAPLATLAVPVGDVLQAEWDGALPAGARLVAGDSLQYVVRAFAPDGSVDETYPRTLQLVTPAEHERGVQALRTEVERTQGRALDTAAAQALALDGLTYAANDLRLQNIAVRGSRVRLYGQDIAEGTQVRINGQSFPVDLERAFVAEFLEPVGPHVYTIETRDAAGSTDTRRVQVDVTGRYLFLVALADVTLSDSSGGDNLEPLAGDERYEDGFLGEGRLAFYLKGKIQGKYLVTAQADTQERELRDLFDGFLDASPQDVFRRLDPDAYYPVYGDDSTTVRDVDTQGKLYVRVDWDGNQALWGNFGTGFTGTEYGQYQRALYGAAVDWRSRATNPWGEAKSLLRAFGSEAQTALGHSEFLGTGGSLYYLRHTDVLPGSDRVVLEVRDRLTGRTETRVTLQRGADYEIDELQGRLILTRPLSQVTRENVRTLTRDAPLDGYEQILLADYEYVPVGFDADNVSAGVRGKQWFGDHVAVGGTYVDENRAGDDYTLMGADVTLQAGRGTYVKAERHESESTVAPIFFSDNGGLGFVQRNPATGARDGAASAVEARVNLKELGWTAREWSAGAWWREVDAGFSVARADTGLAIRERGAEVLGYVTDRFSVYGRWSKAERGTAALEQAQLTADWRPTEADVLGAELRRVRESAGAIDAEALLAAISWRRRLNAALEVYGIGQVTVDDDAAYERNNLLTLGATYLFGDRSTIGAEISGGDRGAGANVTAEYRLRPDHTLYGGYRYSTDSTASRLASEFERSRQDGWTLGQRWRLSDRVNVYNESQGLRDPDSDAAGISHTFGLDLYPAPGWTLGLTVLDGELDASTGQVDRRAYSVSGGRTNADVQWASKIEYRNDSGAEERTQWVTTNRLLWKANEDWRIAARLNYADTEDDLDPAAGAKLVEGNLGFAWRPHDSTRYAWFGKVTYLYDVATLGQEGGATYDQRSTVLSTEGVVQLDDRWELAGKLASRHGDYRLGRGTGAWLDSRADFAAVQLRYRIGGTWEALAELRRLDVRDGGTRRGGLIGLDRQIGENFKLGVGYNFTDFSDDLTDLEYDHKGWFVNLAGFY